MRYVRKPKAKRVHPPRRHDRKRTSGRRRNSIPLPKIAQEIPKLLFILQRARSVRNLACRLFAQGTSHHLLHNQDVRQRLQNLHPGFKRPAGRAWNRAEHVREIEGEIDMVPPLCVADGSGGVGGCYENSEYLFLLHWCYQNLIFPLSGDRNGWGLDSILSESVEEQRKTPERSLDLKTYDVNGIF